MKRLLLLPWLALAAPALAMPPGGPPKGPPLHEIVLEQADTLGLDAATVGEIEALFDGSRAEHEALAEVLHQALAQQRALLEVDVPDRAAVLAQAEVISDAELQLRQHHLSLELDLRALLSAEQWQQVRRPGPPPGPRGGRR